MRFILPLLIVMTIITPFKTSANELEPFQPNSKQWREIKEIELALKQMESLSTPIIQHNHDGTVDTGQLYIHRPGRLRVDYDEPSNMLIIANHGELILKNRKFDQIQRYPLNLTPLAWLLNDEISFDNEKTMLTDYQNQEGLMRLRFHDREHRDAGHLTLYFSTKGQNLRQWVVEDAVGAKTIVTLQSPLINNNLDDSLFDLPR